MSINSALEQIEISDTQTLKPLQNKQKSVLEQNVGEKNDNATKNKSTGKRKRFT